MMIRQLAFSIIFSLTCLATMAQSKVNLYAVEYTEQANLQQFIEFGESQLIQLPLPAYDNLSILSSTDDKLLLRTNLDNDNNHLWLYDFQESSIMSVLSVKMNINSCTFIDKGFECILENQGKTLLVRKRDGEIQAYAKEVLNPIQSIIYLNPNLRATVDNSMQLSATDSTYRKFRILTNYSGEEIRMINENTVAYIYKIKEDYWQLKKFNLDTDNNVGIRKMPGNTGNFIQSKGGNFLAFEKNHLYALNPDMDFGWREISLPGELGNRIIYGINFIGENHIIVAVEN